MAGYLILMAGSQYLSLIHPPPYDPTGLIPIARWDTVPYQRINAGETLNIGVVAFSKEGIWGVGFSVNGGEQHYVTSMGHNAQTEVWEYFYPISADDFTSDDQINIIATAYGNDGGRRTLDTLNLTVNPNGTLLTPIAYVNASTGVDATGTVNDPSKPYLHIKMAIKGIANWFLSMGGSSDASGGTVILAAGTHSDSLANYDIVACSTEWVTIIGNTAADTILTARAGTFNVTKAHFKNITFQYIDGRVIGYSSTADYLSSIWYDNCVTIGAGRMVTNSFPVAQADLTTQYWTNCEISEADFALQGATTLARNLNIHDIGEDVFRNVKCIVNCVVDNNSNAYIPKLIGATYTDIGHPSGFNYVIEQPGAFTTYSFLAGDRFFVETGGIYGVSNVYNVAAKISDDAIRLTATTGASRSIDGWLTNVKHSDVWQWIYYTGKINEDNIIVYGLKGINIVGQGISNNSLVATTAKQAVNVAFCNVYIESSDQNYWQRWTDHLLLWNCTFSRLFYFAVDYTNTPVFAYGWSAVTNLGMNGCCFAGDFGDSSYASHPGFGTIDYSHTSYNHFESGTTRGIEYTTGDPLLSNGIPQSGSPLFNRMARVAPVDIVNKVRSTTLSTIGAYE